MSACTQCLFLPTEKCTSTNLYLTLTLAALFAASQTNVPLREDINEMPKEKKCESSKPDEAHCAH